MGFCNKDFDIILITDDLIHYTADIPRKSIENDQNSTTLFSGSTDKVEHQKVSLSVFLICQNCLQNRSSDWLCGHVKPGDEIHLPLPCISIATNQTAMGIDRHFEEKETLLANKVFTFVVKADWATLNIIYDNVNGKCQYRNRYGANFINVLTFSTST